MTTRIAAMVGATGGAGTTRISLEMGSLLAATGRDVVVFDAAFQTQGLASYVDDRIESDVTTLLTAEEPLEAALYEPSVDLPGTLAVVPAWCPFDRLARAKTAGAGERFEEYLSSAALSHDAVLVDTPPIGGNQAIAAVNAADSIGIVTPDSPRGQDGLALAHERLADIGFAADGVVANRSTESVVEADVAVPEIGASDPAECPAAVPVDETFSPAIADAVELVFDIEIPIETDEPGRLSKILST